MTFCERLDLDQGSKQAKFGVMVRIEPGEQRHQPRQEPSVV